MTDFIVLNCRIRWIGPGREIIVLASSSSVNAPTVHIGAQISDILSTLNDQGFKIVFSGTNLLGPTYTLEREESTDPLAYYRSRLDTNITVETAAGSVTGLLVFVGSDVIQLEESTGDTVLVPIVNIIAAY